MSPGSPSRHRKRHAALTLAFTLPVLLLLLASAGIPLFETLRLSFTDSFLGDRASGSWVGLENYLSLLESEGWWSAVSNTFIFTISSVTLEMVLGFSFALYLYSLRSWSTFARVCLVLPWMIPTVVSAKLWAWMFHDVFGIINLLMRKMSLISEPLPWLADRELSLLAMVIVDVWKTTPFVTILVFAALQSIPQNLFWAAALDGASFLQRVRHVILPHVYPVLLVAGLFRILDALRVFDLPYILGTGSDSIATVSVMARKEMIDFADLGFGSAASILIFLGVGAVAVGYVAASRRSLT